MKIIKKLAEARKVVKNSKLKKAGLNKFSGYNYFTPEQINALVAEAEEKTGLFHKFDLIRTEYGLLGQMSIIDAESGEKIEFVQATEIPEIKATNAAQQIGGAVTYTNRYMLMTAFDIAENALDPDSHDNRKKEPEKPWLNPGNETWKKAVDFLKNGGLIGDIEKKYRMSKEHRKDLINEAS